MTGRFGFEVVFGVLAFVGLWVTVDKTAAGILRAWAWLTRSRVTPLLEDDPGCVCCEDGGRCYGVDPGECGQCGHPETWHVSGRKIDPKLARDEMDIPCRACLEDYGACRCVADCGALVCTGWSELPPEQSAEALGFTGALEPDIHCDHCTDGCVRCDPRKQDEYRWSPDAALERWPEWTCRGCGGGPIRGGNPPFCIGCGHLRTSRERRAPWWEAEHRAAYDALGFDYPSGLMARVRELTP